MTGTARRLPAWLPVAAIFVALIAWSTYVYLTIRFNSDIIVEAIAVQDLLRNPSWVWSYPGQLHGGVAEYPLMAIAEVIAPGNAYGFTFIRIFYVPITGVLLALTVRRAFPSVNLWWFAGAAAAGPALLHDFRAISDIYPFGWLLSAVGVYLIARKRFVVLGGVLLGLGVYEHATAALMSLPLVLALSIRFQFELRQYVRIAIGLVIGLIPMALAQFTQPDKLIVWAPADLALPRVVDLLGLAEGGAAWSTSMLPGAWGIQNGGMTFLGVSNTIQLYLNLALIIGLLIFCVVGAVLIFRGRRAWRDPIGFLIIIWIVGLVLTVALSAIVPTVWFYGLSLGFLVWVTATLVRPSIAAIIIVIMAAMSVYSVVQTGGIFSAANAKWSDNQEIRGVAESLIANDIEVIFGDYWEVLPVAYASRGEVDALSSTFNRLPIPESVVGQPEVLVGVATGRIGLPENRQAWDTSDAVTELVEASCRYVSPLPGAYFEFVELYSCPSEVLVKGVSQ